MQKLSLFVVFGFSSTHDALAGEALLEDLGVDVVPVPTPKTLGQLCGVALRVPAEQAERAAELLERAEISPTARTDWMDR